MHSKKPLIGITLSEALKVKGHRWPVSWEFDYQSKYYHMAIEKSGGVPVGLFNTGSEETIEHYLKSVAGILFTGGPDINSRRFGQKHYHLSSKPTNLRDRFELSLIRKALEARKPLFCICRGHQLLNIARGGDLYQDIRLFKRNTLRHKAIEFGIDSEHSVRISRGTFLWDLIKEDKINVNSSHHQVIRNLGDGLRIAAVSSDGIIEAVDLADYPFLLSVQWHPERIFRRDHSRALFAAFTDACKRI